MFSAPRFLLEPVCLLCGVKQVQQVVVSTKL